MLLVISILFLSMVFFSEKSEAAQPPAWVQTALQNYCSANPSGGKTIGYMYPSPDTITSTSKTQTLSLKATIHVCASQTYYPLSSGAILIQDPLPSGVQSISGGNNFNLGAVPIGGFAEVVEKTITVTLKEGANQFCFTYKLRSNYTNGVSRTSTRSGEQCITVNFTLIKYTIKPEIILPTETAAPGEDIGTIYHRACTSSGDTKADGIKLVVDDDFRTFAITETKNLGANGGCHEYKQNFFSIPTDAKDGDKFCGEISASPKSSSSSGTVTSTEKCITVVVPINFTLSANVTLPKTNVSPGEVVAGIVYRVCTQSGDTNADGISVDPNGAIWNPAASNKNIPGNGECWEETRTYTVPSSASPGATYCATVSATPRSSSNNTKLTSTQRCLNVVTSYNHSVPANTVVGGGYIAGESGSVTICVTNSGNWASPSSTTYTLTNSQTNATSNIDVGASGSVPAGGGCRNIAVPFTIGANASIGTDYCFDLEVDADRGVFTSTTAFTQVGTTNGTICIKVVERPYLEVVDGSVWAGGGFDSSEFGFGQASCSVPGGRSNGFIRTVIEESVGAYSKYWATATGDIAGFSTVSAATPINQSLIFANSAAGPGQYSSDGRCITDLFRYLVTDSFDERVESIDGSVLPDSLTSGQYVREGDLFINSVVELGNSMVVTVVVDGDVTINQNITYSYTANNVSEIPVFIIVANGDINIASNVTNLSGLYMARGGSGKINTCSNGPAKLSTDQCREQLTINGIFAANDIEFRRTYGGVSGLNSNGEFEPAEVFGSTDELYLARPTLISNFDAFLRTSTIRDLPPVID